MSRRTVTNIEVRHPLLLALVFVSIPYLPFSFSFHVKTQSENGNSTNLQAPPYLTPQQGYSNSSQSSPYIIGQGPYQGSNNLDNRTFIEHLLDMKRLADPDLTTEEIQTEMILEELRELNRQNQNPLLGGSPPTIVVP